MSGIEKVGVVGAGVMGAAIAAHAANAGVPVVLLDIVPKDGANRNALAEGAVAAMMKQSPAPFMHRRNAKRITCGNLEDDLDLFSECDWIVEAIVENPAIKQNLYKRIDGVRKPGSIVTSNTSTIPLARLVEGLPDSLVADFAITHFFNPPRYMRLLEIVAGPNTRSDAIDALTRFGDEVLGKEVVPCKDTPGFIANRIGIYWSLVATESAAQTGLTVEEADAIVGRPMGIPKTGIFGLMDLTGIDLGPHVVASMKALLPADDPLQEWVDEASPLSQLIQRMIADGYTGRKGKGGFYRLVRDGEKKTKEARDLVSGEFRATIKANLESVKAGREGLRALAEHPDKGGQYAWLVLSRVLTYAARLIPEIADNIAAIDAAMKSGYAWKHGPFEQIDQLGTEWFVAKLAEEGGEVPELLTIAAGRPLYREEGNQRQYLTLSGDYASIGVADDAWILADRKRGREPIAGNASASLWDVGDGIACLEFHSKMNSLDGNTMAMVREAAKIDKKDFKGLIIGNDADNFSVGANIGLALFAANAAMWPILEQFIKEGQDAYLALKYAPFPVVGAPAGMALGGGCEVLLHCDAVVAHAESYVGLVEVGVGLIPGWGGTKELVMRHALNSKRPGGPMPPVAEAFQTIGLAKVSRSAEEARNLLFLRPDDTIVMNRRRVLATAKARALAMAEDYTAPERDIEITLPGPTGRAALDIAVKDLVASGKATAYDAVVSEQLAYTISGGDHDVTEPVTEKDLLALERAAMARLFRQPRTLDRIEHMLETGKPLRN